jgi:4-aminobutyrate aminotransferase-like enzyme
MMSSNMHQMNNDDLILSLIRGMGLMIGVELVRDRDTLEPATSEARHLVYR